MELIVLFLICYYFYRRRKKKKEKIRLELINKELTEQQKALIDCIKKGDITSIGTASNMGTFNFLKKEIPLYVFEDVKYLEIKNKVEYKGGYSGFNIRLAKGLSYRVGGGRGKREEVLNKTYYDGVLAVTNENFYFVGSGKSFRIPFNRIVSTQKCDDGFAFFRDYKNATPEAFVFNLEDVHFTNEVIFAAMNFEIAS